MTKQIVTSSESGDCASVNSELGVESFERLIKGFQSQFAGFKTEDTVLIGNCPQNVTDEEINKFFCGFATIVKLQRVVYKSLTTNVFIAKFDSTESASRSKVLNTLALNGKKILLLQPYEKHLFNRKNVVELNGLQEHSEEVIYDHMSTFGNVSFVLKTSTVTYIVFEELSAVESSCRCDYLDQYPVTIRSVLDCSAATGAGGPGSSIETCILEQIDQNSSLLADEEEGQINNFMQLLDMENLDEYLEQDEKEKSTASDKPLLEVGNEEIIVTEDEAAQYEGDREADVAAIEKQALQQKKTAGTVLVDDRAKKILKLDGNLLDLSNLPQLSVAVRRVPNKVKIGPKKGSLPSKHGESKKKKSATKDSSVSKKGSEASSTGKKQDKSASKPEASVEKKKTNKETVSDKEMSKVDVKEKEKEKSKKKHTKKQTPEPVTEETQKKPAESTANEIKTEACETKLSEKKTDGEHEAEHKHSPGKKQKESKTAQESEKVKESDSKPGISESASKGANKEEKKTIIHQKSEVLSSKKSVFVQLTKLTDQQIEELSRIRRKTVTSHSEVDGHDPKKEKEHDKKQEKNRKPGPAKGAMKEKQQAVPVEKEVVKEKVKKAGKRVLSDDETESSVSLVEKEDPKPSVATPSKKSPKSDSTQKKKKPKLVDASEKVHPEANTLKEKEQAKSSTDEDKATYSEEPKGQDDTEQKASEIEQSKVEEPEAKPQQTSDEPVVLPASTSEVAQSEPLDKISESVPDISNTVEIVQIETAADAESDEERPLVMDISFDITEEIIGKQSLDERKLDRKVVSLDSKSAAMLKGKTHDGHLLFLDVLPRVVVKLRHVTASDYNITRPKVEHTPKPASEHHEKHPPKKVSFDSSAVKKKEEKSEKPRKTNLDRIDSKFLPAGSKLKSKVKSKTEINHKKHLPVPELPIELKTHLNTSFKIPKKNFSVKPQSIDRNASELNCLHKDQDERDKQRKRFQKERRPPRDGPGGRDKKQNRSDSSSNARQGREPSPVPDFFDPSFDDHSPSPQRIPPTPPLASETSTIAGPPQTAQRDGNQRPQAKPRPNNKPSFNEIWNIPEKKPEVWAQPPWGSSAVDSNTLNCGDTWDAEPVQPLRERKGAITRPNVPRDTRESRSPVSRAPQQTRNTIDSGESWSPGNGAGGRAAPQGERQQPLPRKIDDGDSWSPGYNKHEQQQAQRDAARLNVGPDRRPPPQFSARRSRSPHQLSNTIAGGDLWDLDEPPVSTRKLPSPKRPNIHQNPLLCGGTWDEDELPDVTSLAPFDRRPSIEQRPLNRISPTRMPPEHRRRSRSPFRQRRSRSRSPAGRHRSVDRSPPNRRNRSADQSADRRNVGLSRRRDRQSQSPVDRCGPYRSLDRRNLDRDQSPLGRWRRSRSRSPFRGSPPLQGSRPRRSCSPFPDLRSSSADIWDAGSSSRTQVGGNSLLAGATWDDEIVPLGPADRSPPRLRDTLQDQRRQYVLDRLSPNSRRRSSSRDRWLPEQRNQSFDRSPLREGGFNRRWSRDRSPPNRRKRSRSRSPSGWRRNMERSPVRRRRSVGDRSPSYQRMLDYWKAVEDMEGEMDPSSDRPNMNQLRRSQPPPERWSPPANDRDMAKRPYAGRIDSDTPWMNEPEPRHRAMDDSQYSPSRAFDVISSDEECDFTNPRRATSKNPRRSPLPGRESFETIPLKIPSRSQPPIVQLEELPLAADSPLVDNEASRDSLGSVPSYKSDEPDNEVPGTKEQPVEEAPSPQPQVVAAEEKNTVLENLKQRAEKLKKLEEMKLARQKLLAQIKHKYAADKPQPSEIENRKPSTTPMPIQTLEKKDDDNQKHSDPVPCTPSRQVLVATSTVSDPANALLSNVDPLLNKPPLPAPGIPVPLPQIPALPICPPIPFGMAPPIPPLPSEAPPPPPPEEPRPPEPVDFVDTMIPPPSNAWNPPPPPLAPIMAPIDVTKPPPNMANPLLNPMSSPRFEEEPFDDSANSFADSNVFNPQFPPSHFVDKFRRSQPNRGPNFNMPPEDNSFPVMPPEEFGNTGMSDFNAPNNQQRHRDPRQQQQRQQNRFGGNKPFMRPQQQQQQQRRDPRQNHDGNVYGGGQLNNFNNPRNNFNNNNPRNNFNNNPRNNFNNNPRNNFNNNPRNNFNNNNPGNNFNNNNPGNNFNNNNFGNNFNNNPDNSFNTDDPDDNFGNMNPENNFNNNNPGNFFAGNQRGRGGRGRFNNNQPQQRFNFQQQQNRNHQFNNNNNNNRNNQHIMQQQQRFLMQQQEMFEEGCFDMNEFDCDDGGGGGDEGANDWDDLV